MPKEKTGSGSAEGEPDETLESGEETTEEETSKPHADEEESEEEEDSEEEEEDEDESEETDEDESDADDETEGEEEGEEGEEGEAKPKKKSGFQKRIDRLTAENAEFKARLAAIEGKEDPEEEEAGEQEQKIKRYSPAQVKQAWKKALDESDADLITSLREYDMECVKEDIREEYRSAVSKEQAASKAIQKEWDKTQKAYSYLADPDEPELFKGSHAALNLFDNTSELYKKSTEMYWDPKNKHYRKDPGGQRTAVADALALILRNRGGGKATSKEAKHLRKRLAKEKRKQALAGSKTVKKDGKTPKPKTPEGTLTEYLKEQKDRKEAASGAR